MNHLAVLPPRPLRQEDDRSSFDCGRDSMNGWFRRHAFANHAEGLSRVNVLTEPVSGEIVGYVSLSASHIERALLPKPQQRNRPDPIPAALLGQLAIGKPHQGQGHATALLRFAFKTAAAASQSIGIFAILTHPIDEAVREFYTRFGFYDLPFDPRRAMIVRIDEVRASGFAD